MSNDRIKSITAAIVLILAVIALFFQTQLGGGELSGEAYALIGIIIGSAGQFLWNVRNGAKLPV